MPISPRPTRVEACSNIALIKYWGKSSLRRNFPAVGSLSLTLREFVTTTTLEASDEDQFLLDGTPMAPEEAERVLELLHRIPNRSRVLFSTQNHFPTAAGLASSASGGAACVLAIWAGFSLPWNYSRIVELCLRFSGSAPRSLLGGFVLLRPDPSRRKVSLEPVPSPLLEALRVVVVQCSEGRKEVSSRLAMEQSRKTSPFYPAWVSTHKLDLAQAVRALRKGDWELLIECMEHNTLKMHAVAMTSRPSVLFWNPITLAVMRLVQEKRRQGWLGGFTMDAGPHVKIFTDRENAPLWQGLFRELPGVRGVFVSAPGSSPRVEVEGKVIPWEPVKL